MKIRKITFAAMCLAISLLLPQVFHFIGLQQAGSLFLPMHLPIYIGSMILGPLYGFCLGVSAPICSSILTGMPSSYMLLFMICELCVYGSVSGYLAKRFAHRKWGLIYALAIAMICGRLAYTCVLLFVSYLFQLSITSFTAIMTSFLTGIPGIFIQFLFVPSLVNLIRKGQTFLDD